MKGLKLAGLMVVFGVMAFSAKAEAQRVQNTQPAIIAQAKPAFNPRTRDLTPQLKPNSNNSRGLESNSRVEALLNEAVKRIESDDYKGAIEICNQVLQIETNNSVAYGLRGIALMRLKNYQQAIKDFDRAINIRPDSGYTYYFRGLAYLNLENYKLAVADLNQALRYEPELANAYYNRAYARYKLGDKQGAVADLRQSANLAQKQGNTDLYQQANNALGQIQ